MEGTAIQPAITAETDHRWPAPTADDPGPGLRASHAGFMLAGVLPGGFLEDHQARPLDRGEPLLGRQTRLRTGD